MSDPKQAGEPRRREAERARIRDWTAALDDVLTAEGPESAGRLLRQLQRRGALAGVRLPFRQDTPYVNSIPRADEPSFPGDPELERRIEAIIRWNAMAIVMRANQRLEGIGGHISSYASAACLFEVGFNHFFRGPDHPEGRDLVWYQGHASPGVYARAFLEGRLGERDLDCFRRELAKGGGLSSYPHPWLMPGFWESPSVSMGLSPLMAVYQARFDKYLEARGLTDRTGRVWALIGDGEMDEPEALGALPLAAREGLDNLTLIIDCNLQRLDGPVRGNSRVIQELERVFRGAGWRVIKVLWGGGWDHLFERDRDGWIVERMDEVVDGDWQRYAARGGAYMREHFFGDRPELRALVEDLSDEDITHLERGGHDVRKVYAAFAAAEAESERPTVILAHTVKGYGLGASGEARNISHKTKELSEDDLRAFRDRFDLPIADEDLAEVPYYRPAEDSPEIRYVLERREALGGPVPRRTVTAPPLQSVPRDAFASYEEGSGDRPATTTMILVRLLADLLKDEDLGDLLVPIIPDEARTFGVEALFPQVGIYSPGGQRYEPVDADALLSYEEAPDGQILEEGITEAGSVASAIAAGTAYMSRGLNTIPFFFFYSMFGFQRVGDILWAAGDARARGFLVGATAGRTTLNGEGLQHQDGHSPLIAYAHPRVRAWDPAFAHEVALIVEDGIRRMYAEGEDLLYYLTVHNEAWLHPPMPQGCREGVLKGLYRFKESRKSGEVRRVQLLASGPMVQTALEAQEMLEEDWGVTADVWSATSWKALHDEALETERWNLLHPGGEQRVPWVRKVLGDDPGAVVAVSDYIKAVPDTLGRWVPGPFLTLGTDGFGRSDSREALRDFFEVDARWITLAALVALARADRYPPGRVASAMEALGIDPDKADPLVS